MLLSLALIALQAPKPVADLPFKHEPGRIWIEGGLNGSPVRTMFDSGASGIVVAEEVAKRVGGKKGGAFDATGAGGRIQAWRAKNLNFAVPGLPDRFPASAIVSIGDAKRVGLPEVAAGYDLLAPYVVELDYGNARLRFFDSSKYVSPSGAVGVPLEIVDSRPIVRMKLQLPGGEERTIRALVDTGALPSIEITRRYALRDGADGRYRDLPVRPGLGGFGGETKVRLVEGLKAEIAGIKLVGQAAIHMTDGGEAGKAAPFDAVVGEGLLCHFDVAFDFRFGKLWLKPNGK